VEPAVQGGEDPIMMVNPPTSLTALSPACSIRYNDFLVLENWFKKLSIGK
jgi:hypothetical protein